MIRRPTTLMHGVVLACLLGTGALADNLLQPGDRILAVGRGIASNSSYPGGESPPNVLDVNVDTKYLNFGEENSGFIITLEGGPAVVRSMEMATAGDAPERDPATYILYGTDETILSTDNSTGLAENWTEISSGPLGFSDVRITYQTPVDVTNDTAYTSYKLIFPTVRDAAAANSMQISEVEFYDAFGGLAGGGNLLTSSNAAILAVHTFNSGHSTLESPEQVIDGVTGSKYLNTAELETGFIVVPAVGLTRINSFVLTTANDHEERDPASYDLYGTVDDVVSEDNSDGEAENWELIASGSLDLSTNRLTVGDAVIVDSTDDYKAYKMIFPTVRDAATANSMQIDEVQFDGVVFNPPQGDALITQGDRIVAIDTDTGSRSGYPDPEAPQWCTDDDLTTKYLNFGGAGTGFIITPNAGSTTVQSFLLSTAGDAPERDPSTWELYGTTDAIASADNSTGEAENWTLIGSGTVDLPDVRETNGTVVAVANATAYTSYKMLFPELKGDAPLMQISEVQFFDDSAGTGNALLAFGDAILAVQSPVALSGFGGGETPARAVDGSLNSKYLNNGGENSGFVLMPTAPSTIVQQIVITTGNDAENRDPASFELYGSQDPLMSIDNSTGDAEAWTLIDSGTLTLPAARVAVASGIAVNNTVPYRTYKLIFPTIKDASSDDQMQISEIQFRGEIVDPGPTRLLGTGDAILAINSRLVVNSSYPDAEFPPNVVDGTANAKYLNFGGRDTGFIVTPVAASTVRSFVMTTANDGEGRDPDEWALYGTDDSITSTNNSGGDAENWVLVDTGTVTLPADRLTLGPVVAVNNDTAYASYKMIFTGLKDDNTIMQIGEVQFYDDALGLGTAILSPSDPVIGVGTLKSPSSHSGAEGPANVLDGLIGTKYYNGGGNGSGFIVTPAVGQTLATGLVMRTANDFDRRDPVDYEVYGTTDPIISMDNSTGTDETWTLISSGTIALPLARYQVGEWVTFANTEAYTSYKVVFPTVRNDGNGMQVAEVQLIGLALEVKYQLSGLTLSGGDVTLEWASEDGAAYEIHYATDLSGSSQVVPGTVTGSAGTTQHTFTNPMPAADTLFFFVVQP